MQTGTTAEVGVGWRAQLLRARVGMQKPMNYRAERRQCEVLRLRNLTMIENIRRAEDPAWCDRLEQQQVIAKLGRMFGRNESPLEAMLDYAHTRKEKLRAMSLQSGRPAGRSRDGG